MGNAKRSGIATDARRPEPPFGEQDTTLFSGTGMPEMIRVTRIRPSAREGGRFSERPEGKLSPSA